VTNIHPLIKEAPGHEACVETKRITLPVRLQPLGDLGWRSTCGASEAAVRKHRRIKIEGNVVTTPNSCCVPTDLRGTTTHREEPRHTHTPKRESNQ
jgi:hypothetical protein